MLVGVGKQLSFRYVLYMDNKCLTLFPTEINTNNRSVEYYEQHALLVVILMVVEFFESVSSHQVTSEIH